MKPLLAFTALCCLTLATPGAGTLLALVATNAHQQCGAQIAAWAGVVNAEGNYRVELRLVPNSSREDPQRLAKIAANRALIESVNPAAVQCIGAVAIGASGWMSPDGHESRVFWTDLAYGVPLSFRFDDTRNWGTYPTTKGWGNMAGDGRWDQTYIPRAALVRPVARMDFSEMPMAGPNLMVPTGCKSGQLTLPAVGEMAALKDYFARNMAYRMGANPMPCTGFMHGGLWASLASGAKAWSKAQMPQFHWRDEPYEVTADTLAGRTVCLLWTNYTRDEVYRYWDKDCGYVNALWVNIYRSYGMENYDGGASFRRWLQHTLVVTWGSNWWIVPPSARTVGDCITASYNTKSLIYCFSHVIGDVSLPVNQVGIPISQPHRVTLTPL